MKAWTKGLLVFGLILLTGLSVSGAPVPALINYQGRLTDSSGMPISGSVSMRFSIWDASEFGLELWSENQTVSVNNGIYNVLLGSMNPLSESVFGGPGRYLEVEAGGETLSPRQQIVSVPFAFKAGEAGIDPNDLDTILAVEQAYSVAQSTWDLDGDGEDRLSRGGSDCDDTDPSVYPGATDICEDGIDQDCNGFDLLCATFDVVVNSVADTDNYGGGGLIGLGPTITLRDAINACNDEPGIQTILFDPIIAGQSIFITSQLPFFNEGVYIDGDINDDEEFNPANDITLDLSALVGASVGFYVWTSNFTLEYMGFSGFSFALGNVAVYVSPPAGQGISNIWVSNCQFSGTVQVPLMVSGVEVGLTPGTVDNVWFEDNKFIGVNGSGITISGGLNSGNVLNNINIIGNEINGGQNFGIAVLGGNPDTSNNIINGLNITENTCENLTGVGIGIMVIGNIGTGGGHQINNANISNNVLRNNNFFGLDVSLGSTAANNTVSVIGAGNEITGNTFFGVRTTRNNDMAGTLSVDLGGGGVSGGLNTISGNGVYGFYTDGTDYMYAENNYWGAPNGPADGDTTETDGITDPTGSGDLITGYVYWGPHVQGQWVEAAAPSPGLATVAGRADDICAPVSGEVYVAAGRFVLEYDGGWSAPDIQVDPELEFVSVSSPSSGVVWAVAENEDDWGWGNEPELYSLQGGTWEDEDIFVPMGSARVHDIYMTSATHGWVPADTVTVPAGARSLCMTATPGTRRQYPHCLNILFGGSSTISMESMPRKRWPAARARGAIPPPGSCSTTTAAYGPRWHCRISAAVSGTSKTWSASRPGARPKAGAWERMTTARAD